MIDPDEPELIEELWRWLLLPTAAVAGAVCGLLIWHATAPRQVQAPVVAAAPAVAPAPESAAAWAPPVATAPRQADTAPHQPATAPRVVPRDPWQPIRRADFGASRPTVAVRRLADWAVDSGDPRGLPFAVIDKTNARVYVFNAGGRLAGHAPILLGYARGDDSVPGIGLRKLADVRPGERTTPAGRFVAEHGRNLKGEDIVWVDYDAAVSMHRVRATNPAERRLQRLATLTPADNRISWGCINLPAAFYERVLAHSFAGSKAIVYVLPETRPVARAFPGSYDVDERERRLARERRTLPPQARLAAL